MAGERGKEKLRWQDLARKRPVYDQGLRKFEGLKRRELRERACGGVR